MKNMMKTLSMKTKYANIRKVVTFKCLQEEIQRNSVDKEANPVRPRKTELSFQLTKNVYNKNFYLLMQC